MLDPALVVAGGFVNLVAKRCAKMARALKLLRSTMSGDADCGDRMSVRLDVAL